MNTQDDLDEVGSLPGPLQDARSYNEQRLQSSGSWLNRTMQRLIRPYSAPADALLARLQTSDEWIAEQVRSLSTEHRRRLEDLESELARLRGELHPRLYVDDPARLLRSDSDGRTWLGFEADSADSSLEQQSGYSGFEDVFRGPPSRIKQFLRPYLPLLDGHAPVLEIGCGQGEMLDLLNDRGIAARGIDIDASMVQRARAAGHEVIEGDAVTYLCRAVAAGSLGAVFCAQVVEHIPWPDLRSLLEASRHALTPGGVLIAETVNPHCLSSLKAFWLDPTHQHPIFPEALIVFAQQAGFSSGRIVFSDEAADLGEARRTSPSYALVAYR